MPRGRPRKPFNKLTKWGHWKRAERSDNVSGRNNVRHHVDGVGKSTRTRLVTRSTHARIDNPMKKAIKGRIK